MLKNADVRRPIDIATILDVFVIGCWRGLGLTLKLSFGYTTVIAFFLGLATLNPLAILLTLLVGFFIGVIPSTIIGGVLGGVLGVILRVVGKPLPGIWVVIVGWGYGIISVLLLNGAFVLMFGEASSLAEAIEIWKTFVLFLGLPSFIAIFAAGWLTRNLNEELWAPNPLLFSFEHLQQAPVHRDEAETDKDHSAEMDGLQSLAENGHPKQ